MTGKLDGLQSVATKLIDDFGLNVTLVTDTVTYSPTTGKNTVTATNSRTVVMTPPAPYNQFRFGGTHMEVGDLQAMMDVDAAPVIGDEVTFESNTWKVVAVAPVYAGTVIAAYEVQLRK